MKNLTLLICLVALQLKAQKGPMYIDEKSHGNGAVIGLDLMGGNASGVTILPNPANDHLLISVAGSQREKR
ncbi:MAG TPA: hypothetical protein PLA69_09165, partial [Flavobacterium sp.]|nr:hypothetical protein [Flavobacterium sp.]